MLKFVTTKPPRGRSTSGGSGTPDRDLAHRPSRETSPSSYSGLRAHHSPRGVRKHHSFSHPHQYSAPPSTSYRASPQLSRSYSTREGADLQRTYQAPPEFRTQPAQPQGQPRSQPLQQQFRQHLQPSVFSGSKYSYQQLPSDSSVHYATLSFQDHTDASSKENKFPLEVKGLYTAFKDKPQLFNIAIPEPQTPKEKLGGPYASTPSTFSGEAPQRSSQRKQAVNLAYSDATTPRSYAHQATFVPQTPQGTFFQHERNGDAYVVSGGSYRGQLYTPTEGSSSSVGSLHRSPQQTFYLETTESQPKSSTHQVGSE
uniref:Uncharacterized protein n=1 Tax=Biomphalaria glabrata TaxID=6526 RepID=A0A2C9LW93_BIOGL